MPRFRKKPVTIEARRVPVYEEYTNTTDYLDDSLELAEWCGGVSHLMRDDNAHLLISTMEGTMRGEPGDWIIKGVKGEFYPCKPDIFEETYEPSFD